MDVERLSQDIQMTNDGNNHKSLFARLRKYRSKCSENSKKSISMAIYIIIISYIIIVM